ncbi:MAG: GNAT family N-acetyltransferase [Miniphocaeibacter sp.]|uniref:GNAT family N-acetyltransferase n=1 Tax=Miniphocaeibacter sp. TaxID=3100973 RepID=UPI00182D1AA5|nr:GNAT family N-acetyltransferase [Gallicola sp.]
MDIKIEHGVYSDLNEIENLYNDLNDSLEVGVNYPGWKKGVYPTRNNAKEGIKNNNLFIARINNKIIGSIILNHNPEKGYSYGKWKYDNDYTSILVVHTLVVHPSFFKKGIGYKLMEFAENYGRRNNIKSIRLDVYEKNIPAIKLYERCGYTYISTVDLGLESYGLKWFKLYEKLL